MELIGIVRHLGIEAPSPRVMRGDCGLPQKHKVLVQSSPKINTPSFTLAKRGAFST